MRVRLAIIAASACLAACAGSGLKPSLAPAAPKADALLILPGFGYGSEGEQAFHSLAVSTAREGVDLYVAPFVTRSGLASSRDKLVRFIRENRLDRYQRLHVFAFIAGGWAFNPIVDREGLPNLSSVIYDRSPFQERAPKIAASNLAVRAWLRYGSTIFDVARTPYAPLDAPAVKVAIVVESKPTRFIQRHEREARQYGPFTFGCDSFGQRHDDCLYLSMSHDEVYTRFAEVWPELLSFIRTSRFSEAADRTPPAGDPLAPRRRP